MQRINIFDPIDSFLDVGGQLHRWTPSLDHSSAWRAGHIERAINTIAHMVRDFAVAFFTTLAVLTAFTWVATAFTGTALIIDLTALTISQGAIFTASFVGVMNAANRVSDLYRHLCWIAAPQTMGYYESAPWLITAGIYVGLCALTTISFHWRWIATKLELISASTPVK